MKIAKSIYRIFEQHSVSTELSLAIKNSYEHDIAFVRSSLVFVDGNGRFLGAETSYSEEVIEQDAKGKLFVGAWLQQQAKAFQSAKTVRALVTATMCKKTRVRIGEVPVPADNTTVEIGEPRDLEGVKFLGLRCSRWTDDGEIRLELHGAVENTTDRFFDRCVLRVALLDADESRIDESSSDDSLRPRLVQPVMASFYNLKKGQLKNATLRVWLETYVGFATETAEAELEYRKDDDYDDDDDEEDGGHDSDLS